jgi:hypothetical protein
MRYSSFGRLGAAKMYQIGAIKRPDLDVGCGNVHDTHHPRTIPPLLPTVFRTIGLHCHHRLPRLLHHRCMCSTTSLVGWWAPTLPPPTPPLLCAPSSQAPSASVDRSVVARPLADGTTGSQQQQHWKLDWRCDGPVAAAAGAGGDGGVVTAGGQCSTNDSGGTRQLMWNCSVWLCRDSLKAWNGNHPVRQVGMQRATLLLCCLPARPPCVATIY